MLDTAKDCFACRLYHLCIFHCCYLQTKCYFYKQNVNVQNNFIHNTAHTIQRKSRFGKAHCKPENAKCHVSKFWVAIFNLPKSTSSFIIVFALSLYIRCIVWNSLSILLYDCKYIFLPVFSKQSGIITACLLHTKITQRKTKIILNG